MTNTFLSIITVTLNNCDGLKKTAQSITYQTFKDFEWIIIDGNSTDGTKKFLKNCEANIISETDDGLYDAMNKGMKRAKGQYLLFLNAGDIFASASTLDNIYNQANDDTDFIYGDALEIYHGRDIYKHARPHEFALSGMFTHHQSMLYRRAAIENLRYSSLR
jgi:putative colanic acid biosynthesis glycosyltransferase